MPEETNKNHHLIRILLWAVVVLGIAIVGYFAAKDTTLFKAELTQLPGGPGNASNALYIPDSYTATSPQSTDTIAIKAGDAWNINDDPIARIQAHFLYNPSELTFTDGDCLSFAGAIMGPTPTISTCSTHAVDATTERLEMDIVANAQNPPVASTGDTLFNLKLKIPAGFSVGETLTITNATDQIGEDALTIRTPSETITNLAIASGQIVIIEEEQDDCADVECGDYGTCVSGECSCMDGYAGDACNQCDIGYIGYPNCVVPQFDDLDELKICMQEDSGDLDNCVINSVISLNSTDSIGLIAVGTILGDKVIMSFRDVAWVAEPVNRLDDSALAAGFLERGDAPGNASVFVEVQKSDETFVRSVPIAAYVNPGPVIESVYRIGEEPIVRNGQVDLSVKISDVDDISDLQDIRTTIARYTGDEDDPTYNQITADSVKFSPTLFTPDKIADINACDEEDGDCQQGQDGQYFRVYSIPVAVPNDMNITDGDYYILLEITDMAGYMDNDALPIYIGAQASGDVNGDGNVSMLDVILAFQISGGERDATPAERQAADMNGDGNVTMIDVTILFNQVNQ